MNVTGPGVSKSAGYIQLFYNSKQCDVFAKTNILKKDKITYFPSYMIMFLQYNFKNIIKERIDLSKL